MIFLDCETLRVGYPNHLVVMASALRAEPAPLVSSNVTTSWTRRARPFTSHLVNMANGYLMRTEYSYVSDELHVEECDSACSLVSSRTIDNSLIAPPGVAASDLL